MNSQRTNRTRTRLAAVMAALAVAGGAQIVAQVTTAAPAEAVPGLFRTTYPMSQSDSTSPKYRAAECPQGTRVVGGGARVVGPAAGVIRLTSLTPVDAGSGQSDRYEVVAEEPAGGVAGTWALEGYALCAPDSSVPGYEIVPEGPVSSSVSPKTAAAGCPSGKRVIGTGAGVFGGGFGNVGLQMSRAAGPLDIARAGAAEGAAYSGNWRVVSYAICANPVGAAAYGAVVTGQSSTITECPTGKQVHSVGGAAGDGPAGQVFLSDLYPSPDLRATVLRLTGVPTDGLAIQAICE